MADNTQALLNTLLFPDWPAPARVRAAATTRLGGVSPPPYDSLNLSDRVGDDPVSVAANRRRLRQALALPGEPAWLRQVHGSTVVDVQHLDCVIQADAAYSRAPGRVCVVTTADCVPILLCDQAGGWVAAVHAGWRGLACGVIGATLAAVGGGCEAVLAWLGPAIGPDSYEVGDEVRSAFLDLDPANAACFRPSAAGRWLADLYGLARRQLRGLGVAAVHGGGFCTFTERESFFSYRRDGRHSGRMASLIWLEE